jgi:NADPH-dependent 2,4-dienoyl-CoA reductase/sulfur reductase-like enzyme
MIRHASLADLRDGYDIVIVGAGPAGMAAAAEAGGHGLSVLLLDENRGLGGQVYRALECSPLRGHPLMGAAIEAGNGLAAALGAVDIEYLPEATVWHLDPMLAVSVSKDGQARSLTARRVIVASGALERPMPVPGWTLPGVMTVGGAQTLLKAQGLVPHGRVVLAGTGPLLWVYAAQCVAAGMPPTLVLDTTARANWLAALAHLPAFLASPYLAKGLALLLRVRRAVRVISGVDALAIDERDGALRVTWPGGEAAADHVLLHQGVVPHNNLAQAAGCAVAWRADQACFTPVTNDWGDSTIPGIGIAGDGAGIAGAEAAEAAGRIAALAALHALGAIDMSARDARSILHRRARARSRAGRAFLDALYLPAPSFRVAAAEVVACRCEEVTGAALRAVAAQGAIGPNQAKAFLRCGMGPCQGRLCGLTVVETLAAARGTTPATIGPLRIRNPIKPVTLAEIASMASTEAELAAVARL